MTIENGTGQTLHVHFSGPVSRTVVVPTGTSESIELTVGEYQVAVEVPGSSILPFYGQQAYEPFTHYWLRIHVKAQGPQRASPGRESWEELRFGAATLGDLRQTFGEPDEHGQQGDAIRVTYKNPRQRPGYGQVRVTFWKGTLSYVQALISRDDFIHCRVSPPFSTDSHRLREAPTAQGTMSDGPFKGREYEVFDLGNRLLLKIFYTTCPPGGDLATRRIPLAAEWAYEHADGKIYQ